jgi:hypothetical protein
MDRITKLFNIKPAIKNEERNKKSEEEARLERQRDAEEWEIYHTMRNRYMKHQLKNLQKKYEDEEEEFEVKPKAKVDVSNMDSGKFDTFRVACVFGVAIASAGVAISKIFYR